MSRRGRVLCACIVGACLVATFAGGRDADSDAYPERRGDGDVFGLLQTPGLQREIGLSNEQLERLKELHSNYSKYSSEEEKRYEAEPVREKRAQMFQESQIAWARIENQIADILLPQQCERMRQILAQVYLAEDDSLQRLTDSRVMGLLKVSDDQKRQLRELKVKKQEALETRLRELNKKIHAAEDRATDELLELLEPDQRAGYKRLFGERFDVEAVLRGEPG